MSGECGYSLGLYEKAMPDGLSWMEKLSQARECGFDYFEMSIDESQERLSRLSWSPRERLAVRNAAENAQMPITTLCLSAHRKFPLGSHDETLRSHSMQIMRDAIGLAAQLGVRVIQLAGYDVYYEPSDEKTRGYFAHNLRQCVDWAASAGVSLGFETMENTFMDTVSKAMVFVNKIHSPYLGLYPDIGNLCNASDRYRADLIADLAVGSGHVFAAHLKETKPGTYRNLRFGEGCTAYGPCIQALYEMGVRLFTGEFWHQGEKEYRETMRQASAFLRHHIEQSIRAAGLMAMGG